MSLRSRRWTVTRASKRASDPRTRGQSVVEFALVVPIFLLLLLMAVDFGRLFFTYVQVSNAAREAAAYGATAPTDTAGMQVRAAQEKNSQTQGEVALDPVQTACANAGGTAIACVAAPGGSGAGNTLTVTVRQAFHFLTPLVDDFFGNDLHMSASATTAVLGTAADTGGSGPGTCGPPTVAQFTVTGSGKDITVNPDGSKPDTGVCTISGYNWDFGDGETAVGSTIPSTHHYQHNGTYVITLQVTNQGGSLQASQSITIPFVPPTPTPGPTATPTPAPTATATPAPTPTPACTDPTAGFTWTNGNPSKKVTFTDLSTTAVECPITNWLWDFGDGSPNSNAPNPTHTFPNNNTNYSVSLTVTNAAGNRTVTRTVGT